MTRSNYPAKHPQDTKSSQSAADFAADLRAELGPQLRRLAIAEARAVAAGVESFEGAAGAVMAYAVRCGAAYLAPVQFAELEEWVIDRLRDALADALEQGWDHWQAAAL